MKTNFLIISLLLICNVFAQNYWEKTNCPSNGLVTGLIINNNGHIFACDGTAIYRSTNNGNSWERVINGLGLDKKGSIGSLFATDSKGYLYVNIIGVNIDEYFRSTNDGNKWIKIKNGLGSKPLVLTSRGLIISNENIKNSPNKIVSISPNGYVYAGRNDGIARTKDNGVTWESKLYFGETNTQNSSRGNVLAINSLGNIFVNITMNDSRVSAETDGVYRSTDNGETWTQILKDINSNIGSVNNMVIGTNKQIYIGTFNGVYESMTNGDSWTQFNNGLNIDNKTISSIIINPNGQLFIGTSNGVYRTK